MYIAKQRSHFILTQLGSKVRGWPGQRSSDLHGQVKLHPDDARHGSQGHRCHGKGYLGRRWRLSKRAFSGCMSFDHRYFGSTSDA